MTTKPYSSDSMYKGSEEFSREQLIFIAELILASAVEEIDCGLPTSISLKERQGYCGENEIDELTAWDRGILSQAGMSLAILYAQLTGDGMGSGDSLVVADNFYEQVKGMVKISWQDQGKAVRAAMDKAEKEQGYYQISSVLPNYPNVRQCADKFADAILEAVIQESLGYCESCGKLKRFFMKEQPDGTNLEEVFGCPQCDD